MTPSIEFSERKHYPGQTGNPLDVALFSAAKIEKIPASLFALLLIALAFLRYWYDPRQAIVLAAFFLTDWLLLGALPMLKYSFGPPKPPVLMLAILRLAFSILSWPWMLPVELTGTLLVCYGFWIEPFNLKITLQKYTCSKLQPSARPLRLLHLGDLHIEKMGRRETRINEIIQQLKPDVSVFTGDILNLSFRQDPAAVEAARQVIQQWQAPLGVYFVSGSPAVDYPQIFASVLKDLPVRWLQNEAVILQYEGNQIHLVGVTCTHNPHTDAPILDGLLSDKSELQILLYHSPDLAPDASHSGIDLQLSGHTHGGQVRLPFFGALLTGSIYGKRYEAGRYQLDQMVLYISRGLGMEGAGAPRVRFLCPPEMILWEISA